MIELVGFKRVDIGMLSLEIESHTRLRHIPCDLSLVSFKRVDIGMLRLSELVEDWISQPTQSEQ